MLARTKPRDAYREADFDARLMGSSRENLVLFCIEDFIQTLGALEFAETRGDRAARSQRRAARERCRCGAKGRVGGSLPDLSFLSLLLLHKNATVTICHHLTENIYDHTIKADILISATGNPFLIKKEHIKQGCIIIRWNTSYLSPPKGGENSKIL